MIAPLRRFFNAPAIAASMHAVSSEEPAPAPTSTYPEAKTAGEWAIGTLFVLAAVALVALIALAIAQLPG